MIYSQAFLFLPAMRFIPILFIVFIGCTDDKSYTKAEDAQDAGRQFIRASLDGDYAKAKFFMLKDSINLYLIEQQQQNYERMSSNEKQEYRDASIRPVEITDQNDSVTIYKYFNSSNPKDTTTLRVMRVNGEWLVDLKSVTKM